MAGTSRLSARVTALQASNSLYDASVPVPGSSVGSDPSRAYLLSDEKLFTTVRWGHERRAAGAFASESSAERTHCYKSDCEQVKPEALPFAGVCMKEFIPRAQHQVRRDAGMLPGSA